MTVSAYSIDNPKISHIHNQNNQDRVYDLGSLEMNCHMVPDTVTLDFIGEHRRPVVRLKGMVSKFSPTAASAEQAHMFGLDEVDFLTNPHVRDNQPRMVCDYEFDHEQIKQLIDKGLYENSFALPTDFLMGQEMTIPVGVNFKVASPEFEGDVPILMYSAPTLRSVTVDKQGCGLDIAEYCDSVYTDDKNASRDRSADIPQGQLDGDIFEGVGYEEDAIEARKRAKRRSFEETMQQETQEDNRRMVDRLRDVSPDLDFPDVYEDTFPTEDYVPGDIIEREEKIAQDEQERTADPVLKDFYERFDISAGTDESADKTDDMINSLDSEDLDLGDFTLDEPVAKDVTAEVAPTENTFTAGEFDVDDLSDDDLFATEDIEDTAEDNRARREARRRVATEVSNDSVSSAAVYDRSDAADGHDDVERDDAGHESDQAGRHAKNDTVDQRNAAPLKPDYTPRHSALDEAQKRLEKSSEKTRDDDELEL